ncbi:MAG: malate dehydrogenase [Candidatus Omnitrophica bacterium]|nr:malate dehydrogenase [Candidatus Omnitrophota bacterium]
MKISIIGAGNVGSLSALRIAQEQLGEVILVDIVKGLAKGKAFDLEDSRSILRLNYNIKGSDDISAIADSDIVVITAGLPRKPGMTREDLLNKNSQILRQTAQAVKKLSPGAILIVVTNPLDLMTRLALEATGFKKEKVFGMGLTLDTSRFVSLIAGELNLAIGDIEAMVIGSHGEGMLPLARFTNIKGVALEELLNKERVDILIQKTVGRGAEVVSLLGSGSAYFAPSAAIAELVRVIVRDEKRTLGVSTYLNGEYGIRDLCIGVPCRLGKSGIEQIIELDLNEQEKDALLSCAARLREQCKAIKI